MVVAVIADENQLLWLCGCCVAAVWPLYGSCKAALLAANVEVVMVAAKVVRATLVADAAVVAAAVVATVWQLNGN